MKDLLISTIETICPNVYLQGTLADNAPYPDSFCTFWTNDVPEAEFYDDEPTSAEWNFSVMYYSTDPALVNSVPAQIRSALKSAGFIPQGRGMDIPSDRPSHTGWAMDFIYKEKLST